MTMKDILVLAYAVSPSKGSEYAVAWNYVTAMSCYHRLTVLYGTSGEHMGDTVEMERYLREHPVPNVTFGINRFIAQQRNWFEKNISI